MAGGWDGSGMLVWSFRFLDILEFAIVFAGPSWVGCGLFGCFFEFPMVLDGPIWVSIGFSGFLHKQSV